MHKKKSEGEEWGSEGEEWRSGGKQVIGIRMYKLFAQLTKGVRGGVEE